MCIVFTYNRMEIYNNLLVQFNAVLPPQDNLTHFKSLCDEMVNTRAKRKMHYLIRKNQLKCLSRGQNGNLNLACMPATMTNLNTSSMDEFQLFANDSSALKTEILQIQQQIQRIRKQTNQINKEHKLLQQKKEQLEVLQKRSQLETFNATQQLYISAALFNSQEHREQEIISQLKLNKAQVMGQIDLLIKQKQLSQKIIIKWNSSKKVKLKTIKQFGMSPFSLKEIITLFYTLDDLKKHADNNQKFQKQQSHPELDFLKLTDIKVQIIAELAERKMNFNQKFANEIIDFYKQLEKWFERNQRANKQINDQLQTLRQNNELADKLLEKAYLKKNRQNQMTLKQIQTTIESSELNFKKNCNLVTFFSTKFYLLVKKLFSLKKSIWKILADVKSKFLKQLIDNDNIEKVLQSYQEYFYRNPEDLQMKWGDSGHLKIEFYKNYVYQNNLLRTFSNPNNFQSEKNDLGNFQTFILTCFRNVSDFTKNSYIYLKSYFRKAALKIKSFQLRDNQQNCKDFCVQSSQYYRRDDFKLLQKLQKNQLRKKGLLLQIPYNINAQTELINNTDNTTNDKEFSTLCTSRGLFFNKNLTKYSSLATKRQESDLKCSSLRKMLSKLDSFRNRSSSKLFNCRSTLNTTFMNHNESLQSIAPSSNKKMSAIRLPRNTVGAMQRANTHRANAY